LYGDASLRSSSDLDILVSPRDLEAVSAMLVSLGYGSNDSPTGRYDRLHTHNIFFYHRELPPVELHFHLLVTFGTTLPADTFLSRSFPYQTREGPVCHVLSAEDEVFYLCLHAAHHEFARFSWLYDIRTLLRMHPALDWGAVRSRAVSLEVREAVAYTLEV